MKYFAIIWLGCVIAGFIYFTSSKSSKKPPQTFIIPLGVYFRSNNIITHQLSLKLTEGQPVQWQMDRNLNVSNINYNMTDIIEYGTTNRP